MLLRNSLQPLLPKPIYERICKLGFKTTTFKWLSAHKEHIVQTIDTEWPAYIKKKKLTHYVTTKLNAKSGRDNLVLWRLYCAQRWKKIYKVSF